MSPARRDGITLQAGLKAGMQGDWWSLSPDEVLPRLRSTARGLSEEEASSRLERYGPNAIQKQMRVTVPVLLLGQFRSPLVLILIFAAIVSIAVGEWTDAAIVLAVVLGSTILGFVQEYRAGSAVEALRSKITLKSQVYRGGRLLAIPSVEIVPGDVLQLSAGSLVPADGILLESDDLYVSQATLTGETFPVEKAPGAAPAVSSLAERSNCAFMGTSVSSGTARLLVVVTGRDTVLGGIAHRLGMRPSETEFERGIHRFGSLLTQVMLVMVVMVLSFNFLLGKPAIDSLLFSLALAVGLTPELLPAIVSITLSHGAQRMARHGVIVRRMSSIENFGSMDILCTDKTGTLTEGVVGLDGATDPQGAASEAVLSWAFLNAAFQTGLDNPLDAAITVQAGKAGLDTSAWRKIYEIPYDFVRKCLTVVVEDTGGRRTIVTKGALGHVLGLCTGIREGAAEAPLDEAARAFLLTRFRDWSAQGYRVLGVATRDSGPGDGGFSRSDERDMVFAGFLLFLDPPREGIGNVIHDLEDRGVQLKVITGDSREVAVHVAAAVGLSTAGVITGSELSSMGDEALVHLAERTAIFAEVDPNQKERIIAALRKTGHVVGYMGDGINDAPALHAADVGISVSTAVDVAREAADFVLLRADLDILRDGIDEGRRTFSNTLKYILTTISANFGNMFSMAGASLLLPFLPMTAPQILLNNFLSDIPATTMAGDSVDPEWVRKPRRWDTRFIRDYMVVFGLVSSAFDFLAFATLLLIFRASPEQFRTGWFVESLMTELVIALVVRTRRVFFRSRPGSLLLISTLIFAGVTLVLPYAPGASALGFVPLPWKLLLAMVSLTGLYVFATEFAKKLFYHREDMRAA